VRLLVLLSGGIDSPAAAYMMASRGAEIFLLHMDARPHGDERSLEKVREIASRLRTVTGQDMPLILAPHGEMQEEMRKQSDRNYQCVLCKRLMLRVAEKVALRYGCRGIVTGDSMGQVASQTLRNITLEGPGLSLPILRPLIGMDKLDIEALAKEAGTYEISIQPEGACAFLPLKPITAADPAKLETMVSTVALDSLAESAAEAALRIDG